MKQSKTWMPGTRPGMTAESAGAFAPEANSPGVETPGQDALVRVQAVLGLVEHDRLRPVDHLVGDLLAAVRRQAMHEHGAGVRQRHEPRIDLVALEHVVAALA